MARQLILQNLMKLAQGIGANPKNFMGTRTNITFLGKGPTKNPLFQSPIAGFEGASEAQLGPRETIIGAVEDAMGFASAGKLNSIQIRALELNLEGLNKIYNPPVLPSASITPIAPGIEGLRRFPKETHKFMGRPLKDKDFAEIDRLVAEGKLPPMADTMPITRNTPLTAEELAKLRNVKPTRIPEKVPPASAMMEEMGVELPQKTYAARATMYRLLDEPATAEGVGVTLREIMSKQDLKWLLEGGGGVKGDPIAMFAKYFGNASARQLPTATTPAVIDAFAKRIIRAKDLHGRKIDDPFFRREDIDFAGGGLAHILQVPRRGRVVHPGGYAGEEETSIITDPDKPVLGWGLAEWLRQLILERGDKTNEAWETMNKAKGGRVGYSKGRMVKGALAILNRNKKNAEYMFKASDNVSPGYAQGDMKYNAQLLADQLAEDAGVLYEDLGALEQTKFYGTAYDYLAKEMGMMKKIMGEVDESMTRQALHQWNPGKGRKPNASGGLAGILEV